jgi:thioredoxin 1
MKAKFEDLINGTEPILVDFTASWCGPCQTMAPVLQELKSQLGSRLRIIKIDVDRNPKIAAQFKVQGVPTFILFRDGAAQWRQSGAMPLHQMQQTVESHLQ